VIGRPVTVAPSQVLAARRRTLGFTLIEVLVALGIVALALLTGLQAAGALTRNAQRQTDMLLAQVCADNEIIKIRLSAQMPGVGDRVFSCTQGEHDFAVKVATRTTPNANFRRVEVQVLDGEFSVLRLSTVVGRY